MLKYVTWEVKRGEKAGLVGVNGAGKTTQLRIIKNAFRLRYQGQPNMKVTFLSLEFEVSMSITVKEKFMGAFKEEMEITEKVEKIQKAIDGSVDGLDLMGRFLDEIDMLQNCRIVKILFFLSQTEALIKSPKDRLCECAKLVNKTVSSFY